MLPKGAVEVGRRCLLLHLGFKESWARSSCDPKGDLNARRRRRKVFTNQLPDTDHFHFQPKKLEIVGLVDVQRKRGMMMMIRKKRNYYSDDFEIWREIECLVFFSKWAPPALKRTFFSKNGSIPKILRCDFDHRSITISLRR